jgi:hypothetical protein
MLILGCGKNRGVFLLRWFGSGNAEVKGIRSLNREMAFQVVRSSLARSLHSKEQVPVLLVRMVVCPVLQRGRIQKVTLALRSQIRPTLRILALVPLTVLILIPSIVEFLRKNCSNTSFCIPRMENAFGAWITTRGSPVLM